MKCATHPDRDATGYCRNCGKPLCAECARNVRGALYCETCLDSLLVPPAAPAPSSPEPHPGVALALGFIPGLGAVYNGEYIKALIHVLIFGGLIAMQSRDISSSYHAFLGIALACFYFYMPIEAYRTARARQGLHDTPRALDEAPGQRPVGALILIALGVFLLLANLGLLDWDWLAKGWPVALVGLGIWMLLERSKGQL